MKFLSSDSSISQTLCPSCGLFGSVSGHLPTIQAHSYSSPLQNSFPYHPQIAQSKQGQQLSRVLGQLLVAGLAIAVLAFEYPKRVFNFGPGADFEFLQLFNERIGRHCFIQCLVFPWPLSNQPQGAAFVYLLAWLHHGGPRSAKRTSSSPSVLARLICLIARLSKIRVVFWGVLHMFLK